jgi:hypothetical protein
MFRHIQQSSENANLEFNIPKRFSRLVGLAKGDLLRCEIMPLKDGKTVLILQKMEVPN